MNGGKYAHLLERLPRDPAVYPHSFDLFQDRALLINLPVPAQSAAIFLDQRVLTAETEGAWFSWREFAQAAAAAPAGRPSYIFHVGHCGSTLLSRLMEMVAGARQLREPMPLRTFAYEASNAIDGAAMLAAGERSERLRLFERLWARGGAVVKATSVCATLIEDVNPAAPAAFVYIKPDIYLTKILGGEGAQFDLRNFAQLLYRTLRKSTDAVGELASLSTSRLAAMSWLAEASMIAASPRDIHAVDFDKFLVDPASSLAPLCAHLGSSASPEAIERALAGDIMRQYSKLPSHAYDANTRAQIIAEDQARFRDEIAAGIKWLERVARTFPAGEAALNRFG